MKWTIGDVTVTKIVELEMTGGSRFLLPQATPEEILPLTWLQPHFADENGRLRMSIHSFIVETPDRRIVVDHAAEQLASHRIDHLDDLVAVLEHLRRREGIAVRKCAWSPIATRPTEDHHQVATLVALKLQQLGLRAPAVEWGGVVRHCVGKPVAHRMQPAQHHA